MVAKFPASASAAFAKKIIGVRKMKRLILVFVLVAALVLVASCGGGEEEQAGLRIAIVTSSSGVDDGSFNQNNYEGILEFIRSTSPESTVQHIHETTGIPDNAVEAVENIVAEFDIIVMPGFQFGGVGRVASENTDTYFIMIDAHPAGFDDGLPNMRALLFAEQESGFMAGIAAALETTTGYVAFVGGMPIPPVVNYHMGFVSGVNYANEHLGTNARLVDLAPFAGIDVVFEQNIGGNYANDFGAVDVGLTIGNALIEENADVIFVAAGLTGVGVFNAVQMDGGDVMVIGVDVDQFDQGVGAGGANIVLTSALKVMDINVYRSLQDFYNGTWQGGNYVMTADTDSTGIVTAAGRHQMSANTVSEVNRIFGLLRNGDIVPASNFVHSPDDFPGL